MGVFYRRMIDLIRNEKIGSMIDVGCGEGHLTNILGSFFEENGLNVRITALDNDSETIMRVKETYPSLDVKHGDILDLDGSYDLLLSSEVLEHLKDYHKAIRNCMRVSPICIFTVPNEPWFRIANILRLKYFKRLGSTPGHLNNWSKKEFRRLLERKFGRVEVKTAFLWNIAKCKDPINDKM